MSDYGELEKYLREKEISGHFQNPCQFVISNKNPAMPDSNSFWVTKKNDTWYLGTWLPAVYQVPADKSIGEICEIVFRSSPTTIYTVQNEIVSNFKLCRLTDDEIDQLGLA